MLITWRRSSPPTDDLKDLDVNTAFWCIFMSVTLQAAVHLGRDFVQNLRSVKNQSSTSVDKLFRTIEKLVVDQTEIAGLSTIDWNQPVWKESSLLRDGAVHIMKSKTYVFAYSVLCLGGICIVPVQAWNGFWRHDIVGKLMGYEWKDFQGFTTLGNLDEIQKMMAELMFEPEQFQGGSSSCSGTMLLFGNTRKIVLRIS